MAKSYATIFEPCCLIAELTKPGWTTVAKLIVHVQHWSNMLGYHIICRKVITGYNEIFVNTLRIFPGTVVIT